MLRPIIINHLGYHTFTTQRRDCCLYMPMQQSCISWAMDHHHESDDDDLLALLLSYDCPVTGRKRVAGSYPVDTSTNKPKFLGRTAVKLCVWSLGIPMVYLYLGIYVLTVPPSKLRLKETDLDEKAFLSLRPSSSHVSSSAAPACEGSNDENYDDYFHRGVCSTDDSHRYMVPRVLKSCQLQRPLPEQPPIVLL